MTQEELGKRVGLPKSSISKIEQSADAAVVLKSLEEKVET